MKPKLKLNHIKDLHDARYCAAVGIHMLGFRMQPEEEYSIAPKAVAEILEWLSGPEGIGEFGYESPQVIAEILAAAGLQWAAVPLGYDPDQAAAIGSELIFRGSADAVEPEGLQHVEVLADRFPKALFELNLDPANAAVWERAKAQGLMGRCILRFAEPSPIYSLLEREGHPPYAFSLGAFVEEPDGAVDYESCDEFVERYAELAFA